MSRILLTGATGVVGSHLAHDLLKQGHSLVLLVRDGREVSAQQRVQRLFAHLDRFSLDTSPSGNVEVVTGDISEPHCGVDPAVWERVLQDVSEVWHCAVLSSFNERRRADIEAVNTTGSINVFKLAGSFGIDRMHYLSTAFVAGDRHGRVYERPCAGTAFRNSYERTKCESEAHLMEHSRALGLRPTIYRLGIVVGDSQTGETTGFNGYYTVARTFHLLRKRLAADARPGEVVRVPVRIPCAEEATVNLVTIDFVTRVLCEISSNEESVGQIVHVTNPDPVNGRELWRATLGHLGIGDYRFVEDAAEIERDPDAEGILHAVERQILHQLRFYVKYLEGEPEFDTTNARTLSQDIHHPPITKELVGQLLDFAMESDWRTDF